MKYFTFSTILICKRHPKQIVNIALISRCYYYLIGSNCIFIQSQQIQKNLKTRLLFSKNLYCRSRCICEITRRNFHIYTLYSNISGRGNNWLRVYILLPLITKTRKYYTKVVSKDALVDGKMSLYLRDTKGSNWVLKVAFWYQIY